MIGNYIKGIDQYGREVSGEVLDRVRTLQTLEMKGQGIGQVQTVPMALDAYLVLNDDDQSICLVAPQHIETVIVKRLEFGQPIPMGNHIPMGPGDPGWKEWVRDVVGSQTVPEQYQGHNPQPVAQE